METKKPEVVCECPKAVEAPSVMEKVRSSVEKLEQALKEFQEPPFGKFFKF